MYDGVVGHEDNVARFIHKDFDLRVHPGLQQARAVVEAHDHGEHGDVLHDLGLGLNLIHEPTEGAVRKSLDVHVGLHSWLEGAHVGLIDERPDLHFSEVRHNEERRAAGHIPRSGLNHGAFFHVLLEDRARHGRTDSDVVQLQLGQDEVRLRSDQAGLRVRELEPGALMLLRRDHLSREELIRPFELCLTDLHSGFCYRQIRLHLVESILHVARIYVRQQRPRFDHVTDIDHESLNLPRSLGLHLDFTNGFHRTRCLSADDEVTDRHLLQLERAARVLRRFPFRAGRHPDRNEGRESQSAQFLLHTRVSAGSFMKSCSMNPSFRCTCRFACSAMSCSCVTMTIV